jgi:hypothetical protein
VLVDPQDCGGPQHDGSSKQIPLNFKPSVGAFAEDKSDECVAATDGAGYKDGPHGKHRKPVVDAVDGLCNFKQWFHEISFKN